ncbi:hypothetical protein E1B28_005676 [Marasmius oreades]|uniref:Uncharacterized protein n=1 Tax=Marasmius oreades TaxID=181124 RepID=A0A9P7S3N1_9AGAR|nr:uncharacterized protein E1B28_005676 [Marasmius oreades]KAG7094869.1 hypothetical protein E1B28_005676 [Marasmius oreades]
MGTFCDLFKHLQSHPTARALLEGFRPNDLYHAVLFSSIQAEDVAEHPLKFMWLVENADVCLDVGFSLAETRTSTPYY